MNRITLVLAIAAAGFGLSRWLRLPVIPLLLFAGMGLSMAGGLPAPEPGFTNNAVKLGLAFLVFAAGIELNPGRFKHHFHGVLWVGLVQFGVLGLCGAAASVLLGFGGTTSAYLGIALATSSTLIVVHYLKRTHQMFEPFGRLVLGVLLLQDVVMILLIVLLARWPAGFASIAQGMGSVLALATFALTLQRYGFPAFLARIRPDEESLLLAILGTLFAFTGAADLLGLPWVTGPFFAGFSLSQFPVNGLTRGLLTSLSDFFQAVFFTALGGMVLAPTPAMLWQALALSSLVLLFTPPLVTYLAERSGLNSRAAIESGLLLAQTSEFALVLGLTGNELGQISAETLSVMTLISVLTMTATPFLAKERVNQFLLRFHPSSRRLAATSSQQQHILMLGFGAGGRWVAQPLIKAGHRLLIVDDDPAVIEQLRKARLPCLRGDGADENTLLQAGARQARLVLASMRRVADAEVVLRHVGPKVPVLVRVFEESEARHIRTLGGIPILTSAAAVETFLNWYEKSHAEMQA